MSTLKSRTLKALCVKIENLIKTEKKKKKKKKKNPGKLNMLFVRHTGSQPKFYDFSVVLIISSKRSVISKCSSSTAICSNLWFI